MLIRLAGGRVIDPVHHRDEIGDLWIRDGRVIDPPEHEQPDELYDVSGKIVMAGAIDIHSHIAGGNVNTARLLLPEAHSKHRPRPAATPLSTAGWSTFETGVIYAQMGFTTVIEPAIVPQNALHAHLELADIPIIDKGTCQCSVTTIFSYRCYGRAKASTPLQIMSARRLPPAMRSA